MKTIHIASATDENYAIPMLVMLKSALATLSGNSQLDVTVLDCGIAERTKQLILDSITGKEAKCELRFSTVSTAQYAQFGTLKHISAATFARLNIADHLKEGIEKVIYIDADILVRSDITPLYDTELGENAVAAVQGFGAPYASSPYGVAKWKDLSLDHLTPCFNAGLLVIGLENWIQQAIPQKALSYLGKYGKQVKMGDQEALNAVLAGKWQPLDFRWNQQHPIYNTDSMPDSAFKTKIISNRDLYKSAPYLVHFTSSRKPWHSNCTHPFRNEYHSIWSEIKSQFTKSKAVIFTSFAYSILLSIKNSTKRKIS